MNIVNYKIIKGYFGIKFIQYIINYNGELNRDTKFEELELNDNQINALTQLESIQKNCRQSHLDQRGIGDGFGAQIIRIQPSILNNLRRECGGDFPQIEKGDLMFEFLSNLMIQNYAHLLIKYKNTSKRFSFFYPISTSDTLEVSEKILVSDVLNELTNKKGGRNHAFQFKLSNGNQIYESTYSCYEKIIERAFQNACNQMNYTLESCLNELKFLLNSLRDLAKGKTTKIPYFVGFDGIYLENSTKINDILIYPVDSIDNPGLHVSRIVSPEFLDRRFTRYRSNKLFGAIACIKIPTEIVGPGEEGVSHMVALGEYDKLMKKISLSLSFSMNKNEGVTFKVAENGFALDRPGSVYSHNSSTHYGGHVLENKNFDLFSSWLKKIDSHYNSFQIAFDRLSLILSERRNPLDTIVDGVIAWESLFGEERDTLFKVCGSILKLLDPEDKKESYDKLKEVYRARSRIVHGGESNFNKLFTKVKDPKKFVCDIARNCLMKLIDERQDLIQMPPQERYKKLLLNIEKKEFSK